MSGRGRSERDDMGKEKKLTIPSPFIGTWGFPSYNVEQFSILAAR